MTDHANATAEVSPGHPSAENYGLHAGVLGPVETLAQSVSAMAPSTSPSLTIPLVFALAGNATWFVYLLATVAILLVGFCVSRFAKSLGLARFALQLHGKHAAAVFRRDRGLGIAAGVPGDRRFGSRRSALLHQSALACSSSTGRFAGDRRRWRWCASAAGFIAYRDVKLSAELMLWIEVGSVSLIVLVLAIMPIRFGLHIDHGSVSPEGRFSSPLLDRRWCSPCSALSVLRARPRWGRGAQSAAHDSSRRAAMRDTGRRFLHAVFLL